MTADMRAQYYRRRGYLVFKLDNRGSARRGLAFEAAIRHDMGNAEVADQAAGVAWLVSKGLADPARVGIFGRAHSLFTHSHVFALDLRLDRGKTHVLYTVSYWW